MGGIRLNALILAAVLASGLVALLPFAWSGAEALSLSYREAAERDMTANARLLALALPENGDEASLGKLLADARAASSTRFTLLRRDGRVRADSDEDADRMENHSNRPEVRAALAGGTGVEVRRSPTLEGDWLYVATALPDGGVLRAAASMAELNSRLGLWWRKGAWGLAASVVLLLVMAALLARALSKPLEAAAAAAERYAGGDFTFRPAPSGSGEMRRLSGAMGRMAGELDARFRLITRQRGEMRAVFENMSEGVLAVDGTGKVMLANGAAERMLGTDSSVSGRLVAAAARNADLLDAIREAAGGTEPVEKEIRVRAGGRAGEGILLAHAVRMAGLGEGEAERAGGVLVVLRDVTRLRRLEVMRRDFVANVSHELRTPITTVQSSLETLRDDGSVSGDGAEFLEIALRNTRRMGAIVGNLLLLAGMESGAPRERERPTGQLVRPVLEEAAELCAGDAAARGVRVELDCAADVAAVMNAGLITHAVVNLIDNAIKYGPENGRVGVSARALGGVTEIAVSDLGPGIAQRHQSRVFERFYRVDGISRIRKGTGLGLAIVRHIALVMGGGVRVESEIGAGSVFRLTLPGQGPEDGEGKEESEGENENESREKSAPPPAREGLFS